MCKACDFCYEMVGDAICHILIKAAFRIIPVRPDQCKLLGAQIQGRFYFDTGSEVGVQLQDL